MSVASKYNKSNLFNFTIPEDFEFRTLAELYNKDGENTIYPVKALYINKKSRFGDHPVIVTNECLVDVPKHMTDTVNEMMKDEEVANSANNNTLGFKIRIYTDKTYKRNCYSVEWVDC